MNAAEREERLRRLRQERDRLKEDLQRARPIPVAPSYVDRHPLGAGTETIHVITTLEAR